MSEKIRVGVIGAGNIARRHLDGYTANADRAEVVVVADPRPEATQEKSEKYGIPETCVDYHDILARDDVEAVSICAPTNLHATISREAFEAGKHVLCEKPAALEVKPFVEAMQAADASGKVFAMGFMERLMSAFPVLKEYIARIGHPVIARQGTFNMMPTQNAAFVDATLNGGPFIDYFCHWFDTYSTAIDARVVSVSAVGFSALATKDHSMVKETCFDTGDALLTFDNGDLGVISTAWSLPNLGDNRKHIVGSVAPTFVGPNGFIAGSVRQTLRLYMEDGVEEFKSDGADAAHVRQVASFCDAIRKGTPPAAPAEAGLYTLKISLAIHKSIAEKRPVALDEVE